MCERNLSANERWITLNFLLFPGTTFWKDQLEFERNLRPTQGIPNAWRRFVEALGAKAKPHLTMPATKVRVLSSSISDHLFRELALLAVALVEPRDDPQRALESL